ncbi:hypothetical protein GUJ93_ZPchr0008g12084 [Zizania palustris]|uniref:Uncharacterized protein n=1 Tax=Zizania palustris TaxID=103762 RepID=A0A8J5RZK5_ZIZPA|nr:hypothetical protein GUJ93_ZPchr0008g12084 [Zizania palustris]
MGMEKVAGAGAKKLALANITFADIRVGVAGGGTGSGYKDELLVVGLPKGDDLDIDKVIRDMGVGMLCWRKEKHAHARS